MAIEIIDGKEYKRCSKCGELKEVIMFSKLHTVSCGLRSACKLCIKQYRKKNRDKIKKYAENYRKTHIIQCLEYAKQYRKKNKDKINAYCKINNKKRKAILQKYRIKNREHIKKRCKDYNDQNIIKIQKQRINIKKSPEEIKPLIEFMIAARKLKKASKIILYKE